MSRSLQSDVSLTLARGGTSKGAFVSLDAVPADEDERRDWCLDLMGAPDPMQLDGLGGGVSSTSKIVAVGAAEDLARADWALRQAREAAGAGEVPDVSDCALVYWFAQVGTDRATVDWRGNCGNLTAAVVPYALHRGTVAAPDGGASVRIFNINTGVKIDVTLPVSDGRLDAHGDFAIAGVPGTAARIDTRYREPCGAVTGATLPTGSARDRLEVVDPRAGVPRDVTVSIVDVSTPIVLVDPAELGLPPMADPGKLNADAAALGLLENIRVAAARAAGIVDPAGNAFPAVPRVVLVSPGAAAHPSEAAVGAAGILAYATSMSVIHHALPGTVMLALAGAARIPGTLAHTALGASAAGEEASDDIVITHPKGAAVVSAPHDPGLPWVSLPRTARILLDGTFYLP